MNKGIVVEMDDKELIVLLPSGQFDRISKEDRQCQVGDEIVYTGSVTAKSSIKGLIIAISGLAVALVAAFFLVIKLLGLSSSDEVVAYVSLDINPSIEMGVDESDQVRVMKGLNTDGEQLISTLKYEGKPLEEVTQLVLNQAEKGALATKEADIVVSATVLKENSKLSDIVLATNVKSQVVKHIQQKHAKDAEGFSVLWFAVSPEMRQAAISKNMSMGKYAVYLKLKDAGMKISIDDYRSKSLTSLAKEKEFATIKNLLASNQSFNKMELNQLLEDEKSGKLDQKLADLQKNEASKKPTGTKKPSPTPTSTLKPSSTPTDKPTNKPTPTNKSTDKPSDKPTDKPTTSPNESNKPTATPKPPVSPKPPASTTPSHNNGNGESNAPASGKTN
ncbi:anti-sigma-I factor RsgI family protein [Paenibacillus sp. KN14-4R]|uniref:anti-sigma-I factor RsgI family protein n=1 Tax=Paenibacillus sp. KN14-4R TaxID=3445773 RepID=UPI003FA16179